MTKYCLWDGELHIFLRTKSTILGEVTHLTEITNPKNKYSVWSKDVILIEGDLESLKVLYE